MKEFEDEVRAVIEQTENPSYDKAQALRLYAEKAEMDRLVREDTQRYRKALEETGGVFGGIEPVHRFYEVFQDSLDAAQACRRCRFRNRGISPADKSRAEFTELRFNGTAEWWKRQTGMCGHLTLRLWFLACMVMNV